MLYSADCIPVFVVYLLFFGTSVSSFVVVVMVFF